MASKRRAIIEDCNATRSIDASLNLIKTFPSWPLPFGLSCCVKSAFWPLSLVVIAFLHLQTTHERSVLCHVISVLTIDATGKHDTRTGCSLLFWRWGYNVSWNSGDGFELLLAPPSPYSLPLPPREASSNMTKLRDVICKILYLSMAVFGRIL